MFIKILTKEYKGEKYYYASLVENKRIDWQGCADSESESGCSYWGSDSIFEGSLC